MSFLVCITLFYFSAASVRYDPGVPQDYCGPWNAINVTTLERAKPTDVIEVHYLAAPIFYCSYLDRLTYLNAYHGGLGFINKRTGKQVVANFDGYPTFGATFLPTITKNSSGGYDLTWSNIGRVFLYDNINYTYWHSENVYAADLTGAQYNKFLFSYIAGYNDTNPSYDGWNVYASFPSKPLIKGFTCFSFVFECMREIEALGGVLRPNITTLKESLGSLYTKANVQKVSYDDPKWTSQILDFYSFLEENINILGYVGFLEELYTIATTGDFFVRNKDDYYFVDVSFPFFEMHWVDMNISSGENLALNSKRGRIGTISY